MTLKLSIITPSFNQAEFIGRTLHSISCQKYPYIEHLVHDGGSTDGAREILARYAKNESMVQLCFERDRGQSDAINRGFKRATGEVVTWLNTDDYYVDENVISDVMRVFESEPEVDVVYGNGRFVDPNGNVLRDAFINSNSSKLIHDFVWSVGILQPAAFFRRRLIERLGPIDVQMSCAFDYELWVRFVRNGARFKFIDRIFTHATFHKNAKSSFLRFRQLLESAEVTSRHYGFASAEWITRAMEAVFVGSNGIVELDQTKQRTADIKHAMDQSVKALFRKYNASNSARLALLSAPPLAEYLKSRTLARETGLLDDKCIIATTFDDAYLGQGLTLIKSVRRHEGASRPIIVYDLNLSVESCRAVSQFENVHVVPYPSDALSSYFGFLKAKNYGYKCVAIKDVSRYLQQGAIALWIDAGVAVLGSLKPIFDIVQTQDVFFVDHDDKPNWPFYNGTFCHPEAAKVLNASIEELLGEHLCSCLIGYKKDGQYQAIFEDADRYARIKDAVVWSKHPTRKFDSSDTVASTPPNTHVARRFAKNPKTVLPSQRMEVLKALGYLGHRQDQTIFSILAARYGAPIQKASIYCRSDDQSSHASMLNWESGSACPDVVPTKIVPQHIIGSLTYHHRGTFVENYSIPNGKRGSRTLVVLGNGPSLKGFDFERLKKFDAIGMNAAYRYWDQIGWYPRYYICLDKVVGLSHKTEISRLIRDRTSNGIEAFVLRRNLLDELPTDIASLDCVFDFDRLFATSDLFAYKPITTGSHAALFGALLGYDRMILMGIDCNYVEKVTGAEGRGGTVLELTDTPADNPNYFFDNYQVSGDKYNIPNPIPDLHLDSWRTVGPVLAARGIKVWNGSKISRVDAFPKRDFAEIEKEEIDFQKIGSDVPRGVGAFSRDQHAEIDETRVVSSILGDKRGPKNLMIDIGAHYGTALAPFLDNEWKIYAFEPDEKNRSRLNQRLASHKNRHNVRVDARAVSSESRKGLQLYRSEESTGISGLSAFHPSHKAEQIVDTVTLTEALASESISAVDFLKVDTEGHDLFVLKGFPWDRFRPAVIECEFEDSKTVPLGYTFHDLASYLVEKGYTIYVSEWHPIVRYGIRHDWNRLVRYPCELADPKGWGNLLAFRDPIDEEVLVSAVQKVMKVGAAPAKKSSTAAPAPVAEKVGVSGTTATVPRSHAVNVPPAYRVIPGPFKQLAPALWRYQLPVQKTQRFWVAIFNVPAQTGQSLVGGLTIESDREMKVRVSLGRVGNTPYEGRQKTLLLSPANMQKVVLEHSFSRPHSSVKVQIEVLSLKGEEASLSINEVFVNERPIAALLAQTPNPSIKELVSISSERICISMEEPIDGQHWSAPDKIEWDSVRWAAAGERATLALPVRRDREMLLAVACHPDGAENQLDGLKVEIDGVAVPHTLHQDLNPVCLVMRMPARTETSHTHTELALVVPAAPESAPANGKPLGLAVSAVSVLPERPENTAKPELPGPRWARRLMRLIDRRGKAKLPFPFSHFDGVTYLAEHPDVAENILAGRMPSALFHYQRYGLKEKRRLALALTTHPNEGGMADIFDGRAYLEAYPDVAAAVRSESIPSALEHYVIYGRTEGRKVSTSFDGSACRGTALDLVRLEAGRELKATLHGVKQQLSQDLAAQIGQVGSRLAKMESALSSLARATEVEALRAEFQKDLTLCARTADLQTVRHDFTAALDALRQEAEKRAGQLAGEIRDRFSAAARATDLTRVEQATAQTMERLRARIGELERTEQQEKERLERLHGELETVRVQLKAQAFTLRQELEHGLGERVRMAEFQRMEQWSLSRIEELHSELADGDRLASQRVERLQGDMEIIWQDLESDAVALRQDLTSALDRLRGDREAREGELLHEMLEGMSRAARASELVRVEQLGKQNMEQLYDAVRAMKAELEAKAEAVQQELHGGLAERARVDDLERVERLGLDRLERLQAELETLRNELSTKAIALRQELEQGLGERARADDLERMELFAGERLERLHAELEAVRGELGSKAIGLRQELEQGLKDRARHDELERVEQRAGDRWERLQAELAALASVREARELAIASQIEAVKAGFELASTRVELADVKHSSLQRDMELEANHLRTQVVGMDQRLSSADASVRKLAGDLEQVQKQQTTDHSRLTHPNSYAFNVIGYQAFPRQLTMANAGRLAKHWGPLLGVTIPEKELFYLAHRICQIENACLGRLATSIDAILLRSLVARAAGSSPLEVLEIGTLFGLGLIAMHEAIAPFFERVHFTALDPLEGYYGKEHRDILTGVPVSRAVFDENLRRAGLPGDRVTVIQHLSTEAIAMEEARRTSYGLLIIDGDHRYAGVKHDLESYLGTVKPGGYVLVDDYGNPSWPDVKSYVDAEVLGRKDLELVGSDWHTAVFRVAGAH